MLSLCDYEKNGYINIDQKNKILLSLEKKQNILIIGATGSGKTTLLKVLAKHFSKNNKLIIFEKQNEIFIKENIDNIKYLLSNKNNPLESIISNYVNDFTSYFFLDQFDSIS